MVVTADLRPPRTLWTAPGLPNPQCDRTDDEHKAQERSPGRVIVAREHGESSAGRSDHDRGDGSEASQRIVMMRVFEAQSGSQERERWRNSTI
jgi:hypothetical protein